MSKEDINASNGYSTQLPEFFRVEGEGEAVRVYLELNPEGDDIYTSFCRNIFDVVAQDFKVTPFPNTKDTFYFEGNRVEILARFNGLLQNMRRLLDANS